MNIKEKIKSAWQRVTDKIAPKRAAKKSHKTTDSELGADEVVKKEVFPKTAAKTKKAPVDKKGCTRKAPSQRTRPTNNNYEMIDPSGDTFDTGKS